LSKKIDFEVVGVEVIDAAVFNVVKAEVLLDRGNDICNVGHGHGLFLGQTNGHGLFLAQTRDTNHLAICDILLSEIVG
jgi:hypothetical protein